MSKRTYVPERGDVIHINLGSTAGREFDGPHFALVISQNDFQRKTGLCVVLPTTSKHHPELGALAVKLPPLSGLDRDGWVLIHHIRAIDFRERGAERVAHLSSSDAGHQQFLADLIDRLFGVVD